MIRPLFSLLHVRVLLAAGTLLAAGCLRTTRTHLYVLHPRAATSLKGASNRSLPLVVLGPVRVAKYLEAPQLMIRGSDSELLPHDFHHWAEPLEPMITRVLLQNLAVLLEPHPLACFPWAESSGDVVRVSADILRFDADPTGKVTLECWVRVEPPGGTGGTVRKRLRVVENAEGGGMEGTVDAHSKALASLSRQIAEMLLALPLGAEDRS